MAVDDPDVASLDDIYRAVVQLTTADHLRLGKFARWRMSKLGGLARGQGADDLLQEAIAATIDGRRTWPKQTVEFPHHLRETMRSISHTWRKRRDFTRETPAPEPAEDEYQDLGEPTQADQEEQLIAEQALQSLADEVAADAVATDVLTGMREGMTGDEIKDVLGISETQLQSARRKIKRHAEALAARFGSTDRRKE